MKSGSRAGYERPHTGPELSRDGDPTASNAGGHDRLAALSALVEKLSREVEALEGASRREAIKRGIEQVLQPGVRSAPSPAQQAMAQRAPAQQAPVRQPQVSAQYDAEFVDGAAGDRRIESDGRGFDRGQAERLSGIESRLAAIAERFAAPQSPSLRDSPPAKAPERSAAPRQEPPLVSRQPGGLQTAIAEISARQRALDIDQSRGQNNLDSAAIEDALFALPGDIAGLGRRIALEARRPEDTPMQRPAVDEAALVAVRQDLSDIRQAIELAARETTLASIESGYGHIIERLDDIVRRAPERSWLDRIGDDIARLGASMERAQPLQAVESELEDIRNALASLTTDRGAPGVEQDLAHVRQDITHVRQAVDELASRPRDAVDLSRVEQALSELRRDFDIFASGVDLSGLTRIEHDIAGMREAVSSFGAPRSAFDSTALTRLEDRLDALAGRFDALAELPTLRAPLISIESLEPIRAEIGQLRSELLHREPIGLDSIERQMQALVTRFDQIGARDDDHAIREVAGQIDRLREELIENESAGIDAIEEQMRALVHHLDQAAGHDDSDTLKQLENRIAALADRFSAAEPAPEAMAKVEAEIDRLQSLIGDAQQETAEVARDAARSAMHELAGSMTRPDEALVAALREDLRLLQSAATRSEQQTQSTLEAVHETLANVVGRIAQLEIDEPSEAPAQPAPSPKAASLRSRLADQMLLYPTEDNRPLAPGSGKPDLPAPREQAGQPPAPERKADFIAAARRAAQAAQAEQSRIIAEPKDSEPESQPSGTFARLGQALRSRRRPIMLAIAAIMLALGAVHLADSVVNSIARPTASAAAGPATTGSLAPVKPAAPTKTAQDALVAPKQDAAKALALAPANPASSRFATAPATPSATSFAPAATSFAPAVTSFAPAASSLAPATAATDTILGTSVLLTAAGKGDPKAEFELGRRLAEGDGMRQDLTLAAKWYEHAAKAGLAIAQYRIGSLYERGEGVKRDSAAAQGWYEKASLNGNAQAVHNLAVLISEGANGQPDYPRAVKLFQQAALFGIADSQYNLGVLYARGLGVDVDLVQSYKWFALAASQGDSDAGKRRDEVAKAMTADALAAARTAVRSFKQAPLDEAANHEPAANPEWLQATGKMPAPAGRAAFNG